MRRLGTIYGSTDTKLTDEPKLWKFIVVHFNNDLALLLGVIGKEIYIGGTYVVNERCFAKLFIGHVLLLKCSPVTAVKFSVISL